MSGRVALVGAGPGDPDLLTVRALRELERAEVLLYDALVDPAVLALAKPECERIDVGKRGDGTKGVAQDKIADLLIEKARAGKRVVRLKGGDPFVFGRGGEEASRLRAAGVPFEIVPGVTSALAVPAYAGIPVTDRRLSSSVALVTGHRGKEEFDHRIDWEGLARSAETLVVLMGTAWLDDIAARVIAGGRDPATPVAVISRGTTPRQRVVTARLGEIAARVRAAKLEPPTVIVIGPVVEFREHVAWYELLPLFGRRVLVPRASDQAGELVHGLRARGAEPVPVALLELAPTLASEALAASLARAPECDWIVFTSANAVRFAAPLLPRPLRARVACVGAQPSCAARRCCSPARARRATSFPRRSRAWERAWTRRRPIARSCPRAQRRSSMARWQGGSTRWRSPALRPSSTASRCWHRPSAPRSAPGRAQPQSAPPPPRRCARPVRSCASPSPRGPR